MKTKKILVLCMVLVLFATVTACGSDQSSEEMEPLNNCLLNVYENDGYTSTIPEELKGVFKSNIVFESSNEIVLAISNGVGDVAAVSTIIANYVTAQNPAIESADKDGQIFYYMGVALGNEELQSKLNQGLAAIKESGELDALISKWLESNSFDGETENVTLPQFEGAETIRVAITGDMPPLDYVDSAGNPSGFNVAMLAALSNALQVNIEMVTVSSGARLTALQTGKVDALFYCVGYDENASEDRLLLTNYYYTDTMKIIFRKGEAEHVTAMIEKLEKALAK